MSTPSSWPTKPLRAVTKGTSTWNPSLEPRSTIHYVDVSAVSRERLEITQVTEILGATASSRARKIIEARDTIFATIRPGLKRVAQVPAALHGEIASTAFCVLRPDTTHIDPDYLFFATSCDAFVAAVAEMETGASYPAVRDRDVLDAEIPIPPRTEQQQIASVLKLLRRSLLQQFAIIETAMELKQTAMHELFTRGLRGAAQKETELCVMPENWEAVRLGQVCALSTGTTPATKDKHYYEGEIPFIKTADIVNNRISTANTFISQQAVDDYSLKLFPPGTVLMAMYGQGKTRGQVSLLEITAATTQNAAAIQPSNVIDSTFLWHYLLSCYERLRGMGSLGHVSHLNLGYLRDLLVVMPPLAEQKEIAEILNALDRKIDLHHKKRAVLEELFKAMLHKLTTGEIRVDELDLSVLLGAEADSEEVAA
ncbi:restriction modification system DNA specificity domain-containing protein [Burkholderia pseudomallei]|nr:restriction modification system DNA specificity domain-containing protein [Burkholderia pseudomallei]